MGITGVFCGGTEMTPQFHRFAVEELLDGVYFAPTYGNTLMGLATHKPPRARRQLRDHLLPAGAARDDRGRRSRSTRRASSVTARPGRVRLTTLTKEFFMPRFLERDEAEREPPCAQYPWDGVRNVRPFSRFAPRWWRGITQPSVADVRRSVRQVR